MSQLNLRQIQGFILRMYRMPMVRHFLLQVHTSDSGTRSSRAAGQR